MEIRQTTKKIKNIKKEKYIAVLHRSIAQFLLWPPYSPFYVADEKSKEQAKKILKNANDFILSHNGIVRNGHRYIGIMFDSKEDLMLFKLIYG
jgi:hypothetical protein